MSWTDQYRSKLVTVREAVACAESGIQIAHPKVREEMYEYCERQRWFQRNAYAVKV